MNRIIEKIIGSENLIDAWGFFDGYEDNFWREEIPTVSIQRKYYDTFNITNDDELSSRRSDDNIWQFLNVKKSGGTLIINLEWNQTYVSLTKKAIISMPEIKGIKLSGGSRGELTGFVSSGTFDARLSGGSRLNGEIEAGDVELNLSGGSTVSLTGTGENLVIDSSGGSKTNLENFVVTDSNINISGGGTTHITMNGILDANLSGGSKIYYSGDVEIGDLDLSGGSSIQKE